MMSFCFRVNSNVYFRGKVGITDKNIKCLHDFYDSIIVFIGFPKQFIFQTSTLFEMRQRHRLWNGAFNQRKPGMEIRAF